MKKKLIIALMAIVFIVNSCVNAEEIWELTQPGNANIGQSVYINSERIGLYIPKSFEGKKASENRINAGFELKKLVRFNHADSEVTLKGMANKMKFDYKADILDVQIFRSKEMKPGASACMDCHGSKIPRTMATVGFGHTKINPFKYRGNNISKSDAKFGRINVDHWLGRNLMLKSELRLGKIEQGTFSLDARSFSIGIGGTAYHKLTWSGDWIYSKVDRFKARNTLVGKLTYKIVGGLKLRFEAGAFLDGYAQFGSTMTEMGMATIEPVKQYANWLPSFFEKLKDDAFGFYNIGIEYEYRF